MTESNLIKKIQNVIRYRGVDISIVATGSAKALEQSFDVTRKAGRDNALWCPIQRIRNTVNVNKLYANEQSIIPDLWSHQRLKQTRH